MFEQIRDRIQNVQQDISTSIRELNIGSSLMKNISIINNNNNKTDDELINENNKLYNSNSDEINIDIGYNLIDYYQNHWILIKNLMQNNLLKSNLISNEIKLIDKNFNQLSDNFKNFEKIFNTIINDIDESINDIQIELMEIFNVLNSLNDKIINFDKSIIDNRYQQQLMESNDKLKKLLERKADNLWIYEQQLLNKIKEKESEKLKERQQVFQQMFEDELEQYKQNGGQLISQWNQTPSTSKLEDIALDIDESEQNELEKFLLEND